MLLIKLAWMNIFRNKRRTLLSCLAIGAGLCAMIFFDAWVLGMKENMIRSATSNFPGQGQIHHEDFRKTYDVDEIISGSDKIMKELSDETDIKAFAPRVISYAMITSTSEVSSVMLYGIDPEREKVISKIDEALIEGEYIEDVTADKILIGKKAAKILGAEVGDRLVVTVAQSGTGKLSQEMFRVGGIFYMNIDEMDSSMAFVPIKDAQRMLHIGNNIHEIAFDFDDIKISRSDLSPAFYERYSKDGNEAVAWDVLFTELASVLDLTQFSILLTTLILFGVVSLGIVNTLFMSLYERMFEFGVLRAIGTRPFKMALVIIYEACALCLLSIIVGIISGYLLTYIVTFTGIDYRGLEFSGVTIKEMIYPVMSAYQYYFYPFVLLMFTAVVSIYPAVYAARLTPAKAMRRSF